MSNTASHQITLLIDWSQGDELALEQLMPLYEELRQMARRYMRRQPSGSYFSNDQADS